jgi:hypothetical protein
MTSNITNMMLKNCFWLTNTFNPANSFALPPSKLRTLQNGCSKHVPSHLTLVLQREVESWARIRPFLLETYEAYMVSLVWWVECINNRPHPWLHRIWGYTIHE